MMQRFNDNQGVVEFWTMEGMSSLGKGRYTSISVSLRIKRIDLPKQICGGKKDENWNLGGKCPNL